MVMEDETGGMISHEQSAEVDFDSTENAHGRRLRKRLILVFVGLVAVAAVLLVAIIAVIVGRDEEAEETIVNNTQVVARCNEINNLYDKSSDYGLAVAEFEKSLLESAELQKMYLSICYANFTYVNGNDMDKAVGILGVFRDTADLEGGDVAIDYYVAMRGIYELAGDEKMAEYYNDVVVNLMPEDTEFIEEIMENNDVE